MAPAWMKAEATPHASTKEQRVCYPRLAAWSSRKDGPRTLDRGGSGSDTADKAKELRGKDSYFGGGRAMQGGWEIHVETAIRRRVVEESGGGGGGGGGGSGRSNSAAAVTAEQGEEPVPTVMLILYKDDSTVGSKDIEMWTMACRDVVAFLRDHDAAHFGVEIVHWSKLDFGVVKPLAPGPTGASSG